MKWVLIGGCVILGLVALVLVVGLCIPRTHRASRSVRIAKPIGEVWQAVHDAARQPEWRKDVQNVAILPLQDGKMVVRELNDFGTLTYIYEVDEPPHRLVGRLLDEGQGYGGSWTYELVPEAGGTRVTVTEDGWISNPFFRFMARFIFGYDATLDRYLVALGRRFDERVVPAGAPGGD